jgi:8-oxo-dGTP diphosphatase
MIECGERIAGVSYMERPGAYAIIQDESKRIALVRSRRGFFLPGGGVDAGESLEAALRREILEEIAYQSEVLEEIGSAAQFLHVKPENVYVKKVGHFFRAKLLEKSSAPAEPDHELMWCSPEDSLTRLAHQFQSWAVRQAISIKA